MGTQFEYDKVRKLADDAARLIRSGYSPVTATRLVSGKDEDLRKAVHSEVSRRGGKASARKRAKNPIPVQHELKI